MTSFIDSAAIWVLAGRGGAGSAWLRREKYVPRGGPAGGDGGRGGHVILRANPGENTLLRFIHEKRFAAAAGGAGGRNRSSGRQGEDTVLEVPCGTVVFDAESDSLLGDLTAAGQTLIVARGGDGGIGNTHFKSSIRQTPRIALKGDRGQSRRIRLELKMLAEVGLAGEPNAGKSSLLAAVSAARPMVAAFPFSTMHPVLGVVRLGDQQLVFADAPGLIAGSHLGHGLGDEFLRNLERTRFLIQVVDLSGESGDPFDSYQTVRFELAKAPHPLDDRPHIVAANKMDTLSAQRAWPRFRQQLSDIGVEAFPISAVTGQGLLPMLAAAFAGTAAAPEPILGLPADQLPILIPGADSRPLMVEPAGPGRFNLSGSEVERLTDRVNFVIPEALAWYWRQLERYGAMSALRRAGAVTGDTVAIGRHHFEWQDRRSDHNRR